MYEKIIGEYTDAVTENMGPVQRKEVARELRSHILDSADSIAAGRKMAVSEAIVREAIAKMEPAERMAARYPVKVSFHKAWELVNLLKVLAGIAVVILVAGVILWIEAPGTLAVVPASVFLNVAFTLATALVLIGIIFLAMLVLETRIGPTYGEQLKQLKKEFHEEGSLLRRGLKIFGLAAGLAVLNLFWTLVPFPVNASSHAPVVPLFTQDFDIFVRIVSLMGLTAIGIQLLYLAAPEKWVPSLLEAMLDAGTAIVFAGMIVVMPFNPALSANMLTGISLLLAFAIAVSLLVAAKGFWRTVLLFLRRKPVPGRAA